MPGTSVGDVAAQGRPGGTLRQAAVRGAPRVEVDPVVRGIERDVVEWLEDLWVVLDEQLIGLIRARVTGRHRAS